MSFALYPDPPLRALAVPPGPPVFTPFVPRSAPVAEFDPPYAQMMFIRVAMLGGAVVPTLLVAAGTGTPVAASPDPQPVFSLPGDSGYVGDVSLKDLGDNVFEVLVGFVAVDPGLPWRLGVRHAEPAERHFTWVVADSAAETAHPWVAPSPVEYRVTATIPVGGTPTHIALDGPQQTAYVCNFTADSVSVLDLPGRSVVATIAVGQGPGHVTVDAAAQTVYVANGKDSTISVIDTISRAVTATIADVRQAGPLALDPARGVLYVGCGSLSEGAILVIDTGTRAVAETIPVAARPFDLAVDPNSHTLYATDLRARAVLAVDSESRAISAINVDHPPLGVAVDSVTGVLYVSRRNDTIAVIDPLTRATTSIAAGENPERLEVDPGAYTLYAANRGEDTVSTIDTRYGALFGVRVGRPKGVAVDPATHMAVSPADTAAAYVAVIERVPS